MRFGLYGIQRGSIDPAVLARRARRAEEAGIESVWVGDHVALPREARGDTEPRLDAVTALSYLAAVTTRIRLGFGVLVLPQRHPVLMAKQITSIDVLTGGRLIVGMAAGYVEPELAGAGRADARARRPHRRVPGGDARTVDVAGAVVRGPVRLVRRRVPDAAAGAAAAPADRRRRALGRGDAAGGPLRQRLVRACTWSSRRRRRCWHGCAAVTAECERPPELGELEITITPREPMDRPWCGGTRSWACTGCWSSRPHWTVTRWITS